MQSIVKKLETVFRESWDMPALTDLGSGITYKYGDVATRIRYIHALFEALGIKAGDKIAVCDKNSSNWAISMLAVITYRAVAVPLLPDYSKEQLRMLCEHCDAKFMISSRRLENLWPEGECPMYMLDIKDLLAMTPSLGTDDIERRAFRQLTERYPNGFHRQDVIYEAEDPETLMLLSYTSGSTGNPKGVMLPWRAMQGNMRFAADAFPMKANLKLLIILPMAHMYGFALDFLFGILCQAHLHILTKIPAPSVLIETLETVKPDRFMSVPLVIEKMVKNETIRKRLTATLADNCYEVVMGGAPLSKEVERKLREENVRYTIVYGMTECGPVITFSDWKEHRPGACGKAALGMEVKVDSDDPEHTPGEIITKGANLMMGYYKNAEATADTIDEEGWLHTGDLAVMDQDGFIYIRGRKKNVLLTSNGQNVFPEEAEDQVVSHSLADECVVVEREGKLAALVYVSEATLQAKGISRDDIDLEDILREVNRYLPSYCQIAKMELRSEEFEKTAKRSIRRFLYK